MNTTVCSLIILSLSLGVLTVSKSKVGQDAVTPPASDIVTESVPEGPCKYNGCFGELCTKSEDADICQDTTWKYEYACESYKDCKLVDNTCQLVPNDDSATCYTMLQNSETCWTGGCYGETCTDKPEFDLNDACEWKAEYKCFDFASCERIEGVCKWKTTSADYQTCNEEVLRNVTDSTISS